MAKMKTAETFGMRLADARDRKGLTGDQLGELIGVSRAQISLYENDKNRPSHDKLLALCNALEVSATWLLTGEETSGGKVIDSGTYDLLLKIDAMPDVLRQFVYQAVRLAEQTKDAIPERFLTPPDGDSWAEFHQYLTKLSEMLDRRDINGTDDKSPPSDT